MYKTQRNLITVSALFIGLVILSIILSSKVVQIGFIEIPASGITYPITFLCIDIISEIWGKKEAQFVVVLGFILMICTMAISYIAILLPPAPYTDQESFANILGTQFGIVLAALSSYICSQSFDIFAFHKIKKHFSPKWMRNSTTIVSQLIDTIIFITIAGLLVWHIPLENILVMIGCQYIIKILFVILDTPFFYYFTRHGNAEKPNTSN